MFSRAPGFPPAVVFFIVSCRCADCKGLPEKAGRRLARPGRRHYFIDRGCIVNLIQITRISGGQVLLKTGELLPVSRSHLPAVKAQINRFWGAHI